MTYEQLCVSSLRRGGGILSRAGSATQSKGTQSRGKQSNGKEKQSNSNCDVTRGTWYPRTCVSHVTLGRLCHMLLRGVHGTRGRYPFLCARHEAFLVQN